MSRLQDSIIDDDEESCPLCIEEFDLTDKNFKPCPCGYQICQFCFNSLKNTYEKSTCPNCRRVYDEKTIQFKIPSKEDIVHDKENKARKQAATRRKEGEKREVETSNRRNLAGVRVKQQNLVYVIGLVPSVKDESTLLQTLRGSQYFGQYGEIDKIVVSKAKLGSTSQGIGVYITYATRESAALCIEVVDGSMNGDRVLRAQYGTTKYCSAYLRGENCNNKSCTFLHETGEEGHGTTLQNEPSRPKIVSRPSNVGQTSYPLPAVRNVQPATTPNLVASPPMHRENSKESTKTRSNNTDSSALPSTASWANKDSSAHNTKLRRPSQTEAKSSPQGAYPAQLVKKVENARRQATKDSLQASQPIDAWSVSNPELLGEERLAGGPLPVGTDPTHAAAQISLLDELVRNVNTPGFRFSFDEKAFSNDELAAIDRCPIMIDPYGGAKRRLMREKEEERLKQQINGQAKLQLRPTSTDDTHEELNVESGSLALGGEPEGEIQQFSAGSAIQRPMQYSSSPLDGQFLDAGATAHGLTPQQRQQLALPSSANIQQASGLSQVGHHGFGVGDLDDQRQNSVQNQHYDLSQGHGRQSSRYSFANNDSVKAKPAQRFPATQQYSASTPQHFYASGVQGPPPGLKTAGTPPVSGGGMFAQGHGFTSNMSAGFGAAKDTNAEMLMRGRSGTSSGHDASKREYLLSLQSQAHHSSFLAPAPGLPTSLYGPHTGPYQDPGLVKQKKAKKHRHAKTSSSGVGVVDLADANILQARLHQNTGAAGQGLFGSQNQVDQDFPPLIAPTKQQEIPAAALKSQVHSVHSSTGSPVRCSTPRVPPGLSLPHAHPLPFPVDSERPGEQKASTSAPGLVAPVLPAWPLGQRANTSKATESQSSKHSATGRNNQDTSTSSLKDAGSQLSTAGSKEMDPADAAAKVGNTKLRFPTKELSQEGNQAEEPISTEVTALFEKSHDAVPRSHLNEKCLPQLDKLDISAAVGERVKSTQSSSKGAAKSTLHDIDSAPFQAASFPDILSAGTTKSPDLTSISRPRTLRLTTTATTKPLTTPASAATERSGKSSAGILKQVSRQASSSPMSQSRPSTPTMSEHGTSAEISRAGSPAVSVSERGSVAPARPRAKGTAKKEKGSKPETANGSKKEALLVPNAQASEEVGPIISRQKKKKRTQDRDSQPSSETRAADAAKTSVAEIAQSGNGAKEDTNKSMAVEAAIHNQGTPIPELEIAHERSQPGTRKDDLKTSPTVEVPAVDSKPQKPYTLNDLYNDVRHLPETGNVIPELLNKSISATSVLLRQALEVEDIDLDSAIFNAPPLASYKMPSDQRKGAEYLEANGYALTSPFGEIYLSSHDRKQLLHGRDVRHFDLNKPQKILKRNLITPTGVVCRHLSAEEEDKVLELESRIQEHEEQYGPTGKIDPQPLDALDFMNLTGGLQELMAYPAIHRIGLLTAEPGSEGVEDDEGAEFAAHGSDETEDEMAPLASGFGAAPEAPMKKPISPSTMKRKAEALLTVNLRDMDIDKLQRRIRETQTEMEGTRKEAEALEKRTARKAKDVTRWREALLKEIGRGSGAAA